MTDEKQTLEEEFEERKFYHKYCMVYRALLEYEDEGIFNSPLFKGRFDHIKDENKAKIVAHILADKYIDENDSSELDRYYEYCWSRLQSDGYITDLTNLSGDVEEEKSNNSTEGNSEQ